MKREKGTAAPFYTKGAILSVVLLAILALLTRFDPENWLPRANAALTAFFTAMSLLLLHEFRRQLRESPYSYNTIFYSGFCLFVLSLAITHGYTTWLYFSQPGRFDNRQLLFTLLHSAKNYMFLTSPLLIVFSAALFVSNLSLIRHEGRRFVNLLGILLAIILLLGEIGIGILDFRASGSEKLLIVPNIVVNVFAAMYLYFECMMIGTIAANVIVLRRKAEPDKDFLIVLGCGIRKNGELTPLLKGRLELARQFCERQIRETGKAPRFIVSGGRGRDEPRAEAAAMRDYLISQGIRDDQILVEDRSADTEENMRFSAEIVRRLLPDARCAYFTTNYHVFRAGIKARQAGLAAVGAGAPTKWYFWPNAAVREFIGLLTEHRRTQLLILGGLIAAYTALTVLALRG
ncbi:MAG: YdcF family protein [Oscillospiraceae bacterium]|nr:YdcF family protein [Oscillospiraceae bacterium]